MDGKKLTTVQVKKLLNGNKETFSLKCGLFQTYLFVCLPVGGSVKSICFENPAACFLVLQLDGCNGFLQA